MDLGVVNPCFLFNVTDNAFSKFFIRDIDRDKNHSAHKNLLFKYPLTLYGIRARIVS